MAAPTNVLDQCNFCENEIVIQNDEPAKFLQCGHLFHGHCITKIRDECNRCPTCEKVMQVVKYTYENSDSNLPLPWTLTTLDFELHPINQNRIVNFLCENPVFLPGSRRKDQPKLWRNRWEATVLQHDQTNITKVMDYYLQRFLLIDSVPFANFLIWLKRHKFVRGRDSCEKIIRSLISVEEYLGNLTNPTIREIKTQCGKSSDEDWQNYVNKRWADCGHRRWENVAKIIIHGYKYPNNILVLLRSDKWKNNSISSIKILEDRKNYYYLYHKLREAGIFNHSAKASQNT